MESSPSDEPDIEKPSVRRQNGVSDERLDDVNGQTNNTDSDQKLDLDSDYWSSDYEENFLEDFSDSDSDPGMEVLLIFTFDTCYLFSVV